MTAESPGQSPAGSGDYSARPWRRRRPGRRGWGGVLRLVVADGSGEARSGSRAAMSLSYDSGAVDGSTAATNNNGTSVG
ncbi:hypothetical protein [Streptomyces sp. SID3212]|uniref:hypothetical protein n=1 Tax=Streptomyces sp. SID3212 TaxID=2690259 RepID=UPI001369B9F3|nr:hypothetical protein [Streptomyces sp. SID3212]MYV53902.1 hypothetical protein [Streptomyces sp. SID3212]